MYDLVIIGCGLAGMTIARKFADSGYKVIIIERRNHISGNIYDEFDKNGFLVQKYGPHCFFTNEIKIKQFVERFAIIEDYFVKCRTVIDNKRIPMPFNFDSIDIIYKKDDAVNLKKRLQEYFKGKEIIAVTDLLLSNDEMIRSYGQFMYEKEYKLYSAKQWGRDISEISSEIFNRVPVYLSYRDMYQSHKYQFLPKGGFTKFAEALIDSSSIHIITNKDALREQIIRIENNSLIFYWKNKRFDNIPVLYTGELDALFEYKYGHLPYRSLEFVWKLIDKEDYQETEIVAYPQADKITRITEYKKLPKQNVRGKTEISIEFPILYDANSPVGNEPYYPIKNDINDAIYLKYLEETKKIKNLFLCGRLADYKYYNMDMVIWHAWEVADKIMEEIG